VKRVNLGKSYLGIACESPDDSDIPFYQGAYSRLQSDENGRKTCLGARLTKRFNRKAGIRIHITSANRCFQVKEE